MDDKKEKGLRALEEQANATAIRKALDVDNTGHALTLLSKATMCLPQNLVSLLGAICFQTRDKGMFPRAMELFRQHMKMCDKPGTLLTAATWIRRADRERSVPEEVRAGLDECRRRLEPDWDGVWHNPGIAGSAVPSANMLANLSKHPREINDPELCLDIASQIATWAPWMARYTALGGDPRNPRYLKIWIAKGVSRYTKPSSIMRRMLKDFTEVGKVGEVRKFLRNITPVRDSHNGKTPNWELSKYALLLYCGCERLEHTADDWVHISESATYLDLQLIEQIVQRILAGLVGTPAAKKAFDRLTMRRGVIEVTP